MKQQLQEITPQEALKLLAEAGKPVEGFVFWHDDFNTATEGAVRGVIFNNLAPFCVITSDGRRMAFGHCARIIPPLISAEDAKAIRRCFPQAKYVAMDESGKAFAFGSHPRIIVDVWTGGYGYFVIPGFNNYTTDWRESLVCLDDVLAE